MRYFLLSLAAAATLAMSTTTAQASLQAQPLNTSPDPLTPRGTNLAESNSAEPVQLVNNRRGRRYYRSYRGRSYRPYYRSYRGYRGYRGYGYPSYRYYRGYRGYPYYYGGNGFRYNGRNFSFGFGF